MPPLHLASCNSEDIRKALLGLSPQKVFVISYFVFFIGLLIIPAQADINFSWEAFLFLIVSVFSGAVGLSFGSTAQPNVSSLQLNGKSFAWNIAAIRCIVLASVGVVLAVIDRFVIRGVPFGADIFAARTAIEEAAAGPVAMVAAFLSSFATFGLILVWVSDFFDKKINRVFKYAAIFNLLIYVGLSMLIGSRSLLLACILIHLCASIFLRRCKGLQVNIKAFFVLFMGGLLLTLIMAVIMLERLSQMEIAALDSIQQSAYAETLKPTDWMLDFLRQSALLESFGAAVYSLILYFFHGFYEFLLMFDSYKGVYTYGEQLFWLGYKIVSIFIPLTSVVDLETFDGYRSGIFTTFIGPFFIDFGLAAPIAIGLTFAFLTLPYRKVLAGDLRWLVATFQITIVVIFAPILPLLQSAVGTYILVAALFVVYLTPLAKPSVLKNDFKK